MTWLAWVAVAAAVAAPFAVQHYLNRLPYAPECPHCRQVTAQRGAAGRRWDRVCASVAATQVRTCTRCGWQGRMRWRWAVQGAHHGSTRR